MISHMVCDASFQREHFFSRVIKTVEINLDRHVAAVVVMYMKMRVCGLLFLILD